MTEQMQLARMLSARVKRLLEAKGAVNELLYVKLTEKEYRKSLKELQSELEFNIQRLRHAIKTSICETPGYNNSIHIEIEYLSSPDIAAGFINISKKENGSIILDLTTGEITN